MADPELAYITPGAAAAAAPVVAAAAGRRDPSQRDRTRCDPGARQRLGRRAGFGRRRRAAAASEPAPNRPWLEFLMRPVRAGTSEDETRVEFELTVGNTGSVPARDVRISTWMVAAGEGTDMERMLIDPPADASHSEVTIEPGDGARVDGAISLPKRACRGGPAGGRRRRPLPPARRQRRPHLGPSRSACRAATASRPSRSTCRPACATMSRPACTAIPNGSDHPLNRAPPARGRGPFFMTFLVTGAGSFPP